MQKNKGERNSKTYLLIVFLSVIIILRKIIITFLDK
jgi:hypothetical protein